MQEETLKTRKVVISDQVYIKLTDDEYQQAVDLLTFILPKQVPTQKFQPMCLQIKCISKDKNFYSFPVGHLSAVQNIIERTSGKVHYEYIDKTYQVEQNIPEPSFILRESQEKALNDYISYPKIAGISTTGIINAIPGFGKTITQLAIQHKLQLKTLIVCTNVGIRDMWVSEIKKFFGFNPSIIGGGQVDTRMPITVGNIQTVAKHQQSLAREFGLLCLDEVHHCPQSTFDQVLNHSFAKVKLGLSGTLIRKDGKHVLFPGWFSKNVIIPKEENVMIPTVVRCYSEQEFAPSAQSGAWANSVTQLYQNPKYIMEVTQLQTALYFNGHVPLITSDRVEFSKVLHQMLEETTSRKWALIISEEKNREEMLNKVLEREYQGVIATTSIFSEGLSLNLLSSVVLTSSSDNESLIRQIIGRVQRMHDDKPNPVVVDLALKGGSGYRHAEARSKIYQDRKFPFKYYDSLEQLITGLADLK